MALVKGQTFYIRLKIIRQPTKITEMRTEVIERMRAEFNGDSMRIKSFDKFTLPELESKNRPFICVINEYSEGSVVFECERWYSSEMQRIKMFQDLYGPIRFCKSLATRKGAKVFYYDGENLKCVTWEEAEKIYYRYVYAYDQTMRKQYPEEVAVCNEPLQLEFRSKETEERYKKLVDEEVKCTGKNTLQERMMSLTKWGRLATYHVIRISSEIHGKETKFYFDEYREGACHVCGSIEYETGRDGNSRWQIHT